MNNNNNNNHFANQPPNPADRIRPPANAIRQNGEGLRPGNRVNYRDQMRRTGNIRRFRFSPNRPRVPLYGNYYRNTIRHSHRALNLLKMSRIKPAVLNSMVTISERSRLFANNFRVSEKIFFIDGVFNKRLFYFCHVLLGVLEERGPSCDEDV